MTPLTFSTIVADDPRNTGFIEAVSPSGRVELVIDIAEPDGVIGMEFDGTHLAPNLADLAELAMMLTGHELRPEIVTLAAPRPKPEKAKG